MAKTKVEPFIGEKILNYVDRCMQVSAIIKEPIYCEFNSVPFIVTHKSDVGITCEYWGNLMGNM